ncbi:hypothetical protein EMPG_16448 [Blastomyces silverae]|uniref:Uncharacterized protein n=1 Tax=Blastomyces silverae TaxID=2060906 RepID=A0A0H1B9P2_9EURO|nr:hypothetical protein EMPG_16448 [Blastomyces silverae]
MEPLFQNNNGDFNSFRVLIADLRSVKHAMRSGVGLLRGRAVTSTPSMWIQFRSDPTPEAQSSGQ